MPLSFPIYPVFPAPNRVTGIVLPESTVIKNELSNGLVSTLRISEVPRGGEFNCRWDRLSLADFVNGLYPFWQQVETWQSFLLPEDWWPEKMSDPKKELYKLGSPTGLWKFRDKLRIEDYSSCSSYFEIYLVSSID